MIVGSSLLVCNAAAQPPAPKVSSGTVELPPAAKPETEFDGEPKLPADLRLGFAVEVGGKTIVGNWRVQGTITELENGRVSFTTPDQKIGHLHFRLPKGQEFPLKQDQSFVATKSVTQSDGNLGYNFTLLSGDDLVLLARRAHQPEPPTPQSTSPFLGAMGAMVNAQDVNYWAPQERGEPSHRSRFVDVYDIPIDIRRQQNAHLLSGGQPLSAARSTDEFNLTDQKPFDLTLLESRLVVPRASVGQAVESAGYTLEYVMIRKRD